MFTVTKLPASPIVTEADKKANDYVVSWCNKVEQGKIKVRVYKDGVGATVMFLGDDTQKPCQFWAYFDVIKGLHGALSAILDDKKAARSVPPTQDELDKFIGPTLVKTLTHNRDATIAFLQNAQWRKREGGGVEVQYNGKWLHLCRTDLKDDIRTCAIASSHGDVNSMAFYFSGAVAYGSRVTDDAFFIVDSFSDG